MKNGIVKIHGKDYMTVAQRVEIAHEKQAIESVETEVLSHDPVVVKAKITIKGKPYTGISSVNLESPRLIERDNPYEVAETSAVGRALGFAGYGIVESIASADEMARAVSPKSNGTNPSTTQALLSVPTEEAAQLICDICGKPAFRRKGTTKGGRAYQGIFCSTGNRQHTKWLWN